MRRVTGRVNSTSRKRIPWHEIHMALKPAENDLPMAIAVGFDAARWSFAETARVVVEVTQRSARMRFDRGTVGEPEVGQWMTLDRLDPTLPLWVRVKVVDQSDWPGRLLAASRPFAPVLQGGTDGGGRQPLLHVQAWKLGEEVWQIQFSDEAPPVLLYNDRLFGLKDRLRARALVSSLVLPMALRLVLREIRRRTEEGREGSWQADWLRFCESLGGSGEVPAEDDEYEPWEDGVVRLFCKRHDLVTGASRVLDARGWR